MQKPVMETSTPSISERARVIIYSRPGCHLCEEAKQAIESAQCANEYTLEEIDIESDVALLQRYRSDIPVITINDEEAFRHKVRADEFRRRLAGAKRGLSSAPPRSPKCSMTNEK